MRRYEDIYRVKLRDNLGDPEFWNRRFLDIDLRLAQAEKSLEDLDAVANRVEATALNRIDNVLTPLAREAVERLTSVATLFDATTTTTLTIGVGERRMDIPEGKRLTFAPLSYLVIFPAGDLSRYMIARTVSYDRNAGQLVVEAIQAVGEGVESDWQIAPVAFVAALQDLADSAASAANIATGARTDALQAKTDALAAKADAVQAKTDAVQAKVDAVTAKGLAEGARDTAVAAKVDAVNAANSINPANLFTKAGKATVAQFQAGDGGAGALTPGTVLDAMSPVALTPGALIAVSHAGGVKRSVAHTENATIDNPTDQKIGWPLSFDITPNGFTTAWGSAFLFGDDGPPDVTVRSVVLFECWGADTYVYTGTRKIA